MRSTVCFIASALLLGVQCSPPEPSSPHALLEDTQEDDEVSLLQRRAAHQVDTKIRGERDLVLIHIPFNFGHTLENVAMFGSGPFSAAKMSSYIYSLGGFGEISRQASWEEARRMTRTGGEIWGHLNPDLQVTSEVTGCPMYYTPQKYWPKGLAEKYIGNRTTFGMLRDPAERLVAFFRGNTEGYGGSYPEFLKTCNVNAAVKQMMKDYIGGNNTFAEGCTFLPQAEFFDGPYGIKLPINNRQFPASMNKVLFEHGYPDFEIHTSDILHVSHCNDVWSGDLDPETRSLIRQVYARDYELLCEHFSYCDRDESACIWQVPLMCPAEVLAAGYQG